jgi:hypothetical protein
VAPLHLTQGSPGLSPIKQGRRFGNIPGNNLQISPRWFPGLYLGSRRGASPSARNRQPNRAQLRAGSCAAGGAWPPDALARVVL